MAKRKLVKKKSTKKVVLKKKKKVKKKVTPKKQETKYQKITAEVCLGSTAITEERAKELLGWQEEEKEKYKQNYLLKVAGVKIRCVSNVLNRPLYKAVTDTLRQEILRGRWQFNGEPIIVGKSGTILNGQHTLIALVTAVALWRECPEEYPAWKTEPTLQKLIVYGVEEDDSTVNTMDTCKPRSLKDVIYRAEYFNSLAGPARKASARATEYAIRKMWEHTGSRANPYCPRATHSEMVAFLDHHPKLVECVVHILLQNKENNLSRFVKVGSATALMYLMAASKTDTKKYHSSHTLEEKNVCFDNWEKAEQFFTALVTGDKRFSALTAKIKQMLSTSVGGVTADESWAVLVLAWNNFVKNKTITTASLKLDYGYKNDAKILTGHPLIGGIDVGVEGTDFVFAKDPTEETISRRAKKAKAKPKTDPKSKKGSQRLKGRWSVNDTVWVYDPKDTYEAPYFGKLIGLPFATKVRGEELEQVMVDCSDGLFEVPTDNLSVKYPLGL